MLRFTSTSFCILILALLMTPADSFILGGDQGISTGSFQFQKLSTLYLPYTYTPQPQYKGDEDAAEQLAFDHKTNLLYCIGNANIHVIDMSDVTNLTVLYHTTISNVDITDVEVCGDYLFVAMDNETKREKGFVNVYRTYDKKNGPLELLHHITVGAVPDMIQLTSDCSKVIVAIEAEPYDDEVQNRLVDPPGGVGIITFMNSPAGNYSVSTLGFEAFNDMVPELEKSGVRHVYKDNKNPFSNDVEPEYIAIDDSETKAYICLQENNAIAVVNLETKTIESIYGLGFKNWSSLSLDVSDKDNGIDMRPWPVYGMYQPDSIHLYKHRGTLYLISANEGDTKNFHHYSEVARVSDLTLSEKFESNATVRAQLQAKDALGRLRVTKENGKNATTGQYDRLYTFGGRSFSIWRADNMELVYDSGNDISTKIATLMPDLFNNGYEGGDVVTESQDSRSDNEGPSTESIAIGKFGSKTVLFLGNERPGIISVYSIDENSESLVPRFETLLSDIPRVDDTWDNLYKNREISMIDPEDMKYISADRSPNDRPLLVVGGSVSGTITVIQMSEYAEDKPPTDDNDTNSSGQTCGSIGLILLCAVMYLLKISN